MSTAIAERPNAEAEVRTKEISGSLLDQLELALAGTPARTSVRRALSDLNRRLGPARRKTAARPVDLRRRGVGAKPLSKLCHYFCESAEGLELLGYRFRVVFRYTGDGNADLPPAWYLAEFGTFSEGGNLGLDDRNRRRKARVSTAG